MNAFTQPTGIASNQQSCYFESDNNHAPQKASIDDRRVTDDQRKDKQELDALLSQAINGLTFEERQKHLEVLHGVDQVSEDAAFMDRAVQNLDQHLLDKKRKGSSYEIAERMDPSYVHSRAFRVMFLRANEYDPEESADQMLRFFDLKHELFGEEKLTKDITMNDLDEDDLACLQAGYPQLRGRDRSGRHIFIYIGALMGNTPYKTIKNDLRAQFFVVMRALRSTETQIRGTVTIWFSVGDSKSKLGGGYLENWMAGRALPRKHSATHICVDELHQSLLHTPVIKAMNQSQRARLRLHFGSSSECLHQLSTYGIPKQSLPLNADGSLNLDTHLQWIQSCTTEDAELVQPPSPPALDNQVIDTTPSENDVLFSGGKITNHPGTIGFRELVKDLFVQYSSGTEESKRRIVENLIERVQVSGGRFLRQTQNSQWEQVQSKELRQKVMQSFRNRRRMDTYKPKVSIGTLITNEPLPNDVVFGKVERNQGTELLHLLIQNHFQEYESLDRGFKMKLVETIMSRIASQGGRFLKVTEEPNQWLELSHECARERISKCFRNYRRPQRKTSR